MKEWVGRGGKWIEPSQNISTTNIDAYFYSLLIAPFDNLKEIIAKFMVSRYHDGEIWINKTIAIKHYLIIAIIVLSIKGPTIAIVSKPITMVKEFIRTPTWKYSKGQTINNV